MSTDQQEASIPAQRDWAHKAAGKADVRVVREFDDPGIAGGEVEHRPGLQALLDFCEQQFKHGRPVEAVLVWDPDRLSRADSLKTSAVLSRLKDAGVCRLLTASDGWVDLDDVTHRILYLLKQDLARAGFCEGIARNTLRGKQAKAERGLWVCGAPPYGYRIEAGRLAPDPGAGPVVSWIFSAYASGTHTLSSMTKELERRGTVTYREALRRAEGLPAQPVRWNRRTLQGILLNRVYLGHLVWNRLHKGRYARLKGGAVTKDDTARAREQERRRRGGRNLAGVLNAAADVFELPNAHPALTDPETFAQAQKRLSVNRGRTTPVRGGGPWLLTGLAKCGRCGGPMVGQTSVCGKTGHAMRYYRCDRARNRRCDARVCVRQQMLVEEVAAEIRDRFADGPALDALFAEVKRLATAGAADLDAERGRLRARLADLDAKVRQGTVNLATLPPDLLPAVVEQVRQWQKEREQAAVELERLGAAAASHQDAAGKIKAALAQIRKLHKVILSADPAEGRAALAGIVKAVRVHFRPGGRVFEVAAVEVEMADALVGLFTTSAPRIEPAAAPARAPAPAPPGRRSTAACARRGARPAPGCGRSRCRAGPPPAGAAPPAPPAPPSAGPRP
jgi:DNA invertase Pin-like site-specific DNA recombinase